MAEVAPFRALRFNKDIDLSKVTTPPYDVIDPEHQDAFYRADPHNIIRLELNKAEPGDNEQHNVYTRSAGFLKQWRSEGILNQDCKPAFYFNETTYEDDQGNPRIRRGFFCALKIEDFSAGIVLPHERTFTKHKEDRLLLTKATGCNISPILGLFPGSTNRVNKLLAQAAGNSPVEDFVDSDGLRQRLYLIDDEQVCRQVQKILADKKIYIADGHHRYETALNYRNYMREQCPEAGDQAAFNYVLTYLCSMSEPGLTVFATHRVLPKAHQFDLIEFMNLAQDMFQIKSIPIDGDPAGALAQLRQAMQPSRSGLTRLGLAARGAGSLYLLSLKPEALRHQALLEQAPLMRDLDVVILTELLVHNILGFDVQARDQVQSIRYIAGLDKAAEQVFSGKADLAFLMNPTKISQMKAVAEAGLIMPRKSTYFYPKVLTGLVINPLNPEEQISG